MKRFLTCALCFVSLPAVAVTLYYEQGGACPGLYTYKPSLGCPTSGVSRLNVTPIPNTVFNDRTPVYTFLKTKTNKTLEYGHNFTKNIYETVYYNNIIKVNMLNRKTNEYSIKGGTTLAKSSMDVGNNPLTYEQCQLKRFRINYVDGTSSIGNIGESIYSVEPYNFGNVMLKFDIYVRNKIKNIELLSKDSVIDETIYNTITLLDNNLNVSDLEIGKYYKISQKIECRWRL